MDDKNIKLQSSIPGTNQLGSGNMKYETANLNKDLPIFGNLPSCFEL